MKYAAALFALVAATAALPAAPDAASAAERIIDMTFCERKDFDGCKIYENIPRGQCLPIPDRFLDNLESIQFHGSDQCTFYRDAGCTGDNFTDAGSVPELHRKFRDKLSSYQCS